MTLWEEAARLLESGEACPTDDLDRQIRELIRTRPWTDVSARLASFYRELRHGRSTEAEAATWAAQQLPSLRPQGWEHAPTGEALETVVLAAWGMRSRV